MSSTQMPIATGKGTVIEIPTSLKYRPLPRPLEEATNSNVQAVLRKVDAEGNFPCRRCLRDGKVGDTMRLFSYDPWFGDSPYRQAGPIFVHQSPECKLAEFPAGSNLPDQQRTRSLSVRAFNQDHMMVAFDTIDGEKLIDVAESMLEVDGKERAEYIHVHYPGPWCFAVRIDRGN